MNFLRVVFTLTETFYIRRDSKTNINTGAAMTDDDSLSTTKSPTNYSKNVQLLKCEYLLVLCDCKLTFFRPNS